MADVLPQMNFRLKGNKLCIDHANDELLFMCKDCDETLVCSTCISTSHIGHKVIAIRIILQEKFNKLQDLNTAIQDIKIPHMQRKIETTENEVKEAKKGIRVLKKNVIDHGLYLKELIDISTSETVSELEDTENKITKEFDQFKLDCERWINRLEGLLKESKQATQSDNNILIIDVEKDLTSLTTAEPEFEVEYPKCIFIQGSEAETYIKAAFGNVEIEKHRDRRALGHQATGPSEQSSLKLMEAPELLSTLTDLEFIPETIVTSSNGKVWMCGCNITNIYTLDVKAVNVNVPVFDISIHPVTDELYFLSVWDNSVRTVNTLNSNITTLFTMPYKPFCMAVTRSGDILVGSNDKPSVTLFTETGSPVMARDTIDRIYRMSVCRTTGYIAMSCRTGVRVTVLDDQLRHVYTCEPRDIGFYAIDADFDNVGHLLIASYKNSTIYIADGTTGDILKRIYVNKTKVHCLLPQKDGTVALGIEEPKRILAMKYLE